MIGKEKIELNTTQNRERGIFNRDLLIFIFFLILSFVFWYLNSLSEEIVGDVNYPVRYINTPSDRVMTGEMPSRLNMSVRGPGYSILKLKLSGNQAPVIIDLSTENYVIVPKSKLLDYYIITSGLIQTFEQQLRADFEIISIKPDTLFFKFDKVITRTVPVAPLVEVTTERQYFVNGPVTSNPEKVEISGPQQIIDTIKAVNTKKIRLSQLNKSTTRNIALTGSKEFEINVKRVAITVPVEQFTEASIDIPVRLLNLPDSLDIKIFPDVVNVKYLIGISDFKTAGELPLNAVIDLDEYDLGKVNKLQVVIENTPATISSLRFSPQKVDFVIEKKKR